MLNQEFRIKRGKAFTEPEKLHLYQCMLPDLEIIDNKALDSISVVRKNEAWRRVTVKFNSHPSVFQRTTEQLKKCFENAKCRKQWVVPADSPKGILQPVALSSTPRTYSATSSSRQYQNRVNGAVEMPDNTVSEFGQYQEDVHSNLTNLEQRLDNIKCELVDLADGSEDPGDTSAIVDVQPALTVFVEETHQSDYTDGQQNLLGLERRLASNSEDVADDLEDGTESIFLEQSIYQAAEAQRSYNPRKRLRRHPDSLQSEDDPATKTLRSSQIEALEERLLKAQVREAEAAASAAEVQLQLNQMALQHATAEEERRKQLHALRVRRLNQLVSDP